MKENYVAYSPDVEILLDNENQVIDELIASMRRLDGRTKEMYGHHVRVSHAKSHGLAVGTLSIPGNLPEYLAQGLFAKAGTYPVIARLSNVPGEVAPDSVNTQRGFAFKILGVDGPVIPEHDGTDTQDFVLDTGKYFITPDAKGFMQQHKTLTEHLPQVPNIIKEAVSAVSRVTNEALNTLGTNNAKLDFFGDSRIHPMAEAYYSQAPIRYGDYIAKLAVVPISPAQKELAKNDVDVDTYNDKNALRTATVGYLKEHNAEFEVRIQLCTDLKKMPVEDAKVEWDEEESPYLPVATISLPKQDAYSEARQRYVEGLSFCPAHSLEAHRPLGSIMRARLRAYPEMSKVRRTGNNNPLGEPKSIDEVPA